MLLFDSWYDVYRGVICLVAIVDGAVSKGSLRLSFPHDVVYIELCTSDSSYNMQSRFSANHSDKHLVLAVCVHVRLNTVIVAVLQ